VFWWRTMRDAAFRKLVTSDIVFLESFCLIGYVAVRIFSFRDWWNWLQRYSGYDGWVPVLKFQNPLIWAIEFTSKKYPSACRLEASNFIRLLCHTSVLTLQMFIA
jgi:hypothetical protein